MGKKVISERANKENVKSILGKEKKMKSSDTHPPPSQRSYREHGLSQEKKSKRHKKFKEEIIKQLSEMKSKS